MPRVLVLGGTGLLGHMVLKVLGRTPSLQVEGTSRREPADPLHLDVERGAGALSALLRRRGPYAYLINAIGVTCGEINERDPHSVHRAIRVNAVFPHELAVAAAEVSAKVIHLSTDGVFSGRGGSYLEDAPHDCADVYGKTKSLGEVPFRHVLTLRCSLVGPDPSSRTGLLEWLLGQPDGATVPGYTDRMWNGVTTLQFARLCERIITQGGFDECWSESPVHHVCPNTAVSKEELLRLCAEVFEKPVRIVPTRAGAVPLNHTLATRYETLGRLWGSNIPMAAALRELADAMALEALPR